MFQQIQVVSLLEIDVTSVLLSLFLFSDCSDVPESRWGSDEQRKVSAASRTTLPSFLSTLFAFPTSNMDR